MQDKFSKYAVSDDGIDKFSKYAVEEPQQTKEEERQAWFSRYPRDIAAGLLEGGRGILNVPYQLHLPLAHHFKPTNFNKIVGLKGQPELIDKLLQGGGEFLPALIAPELSLGKVGKAIEEMPKVGKYLKSILGNAIPQGIYSATQSEEHPISEGLKAGAVSAPFSALMTALGQRNPLVRALARTGLGGLGAGVGYLGAKSLGLSPTAEFGAAGLGGFLGLAGRNPRRIALQKIGEGVENTPYQQKLAAASRLGMDYLTPAEASGNPYLASLQGATGKSEAGSKALYEAGQQRIGQEKAAINNLFNTIHPEELDQKVSSLYKHAYEKNVPESLIMPLKENEVFKKAENIVNGKPAFKESLKGVDKGSIAYLDHVKKAIDDMASSAKNKGQNSEYRIIEQTRTKLLDTMDKIAPEYQEARMQAERQITRRNLEKKLNEYDIKGTNFFRAALNNDKKFDELMHSVRNAPGAQEQLKDMRLIFRDLINPPTPRTAAGFTKAGMNQARSSLQAYKDMLSEVFSRGKNDKSMVDIITNPKWAEDIKKIESLKGYEKKLMAILRLFGKVSGSSLTASNKPLDLELNTAQDSAPRSSF